MDRLRETVQEFLVDYYEYLPEYIPVLDKLPTPNKFLNYVLTNLPFIVRCDEFEQFAAVELWKDNGYLRKMMEERKVTVAVTPDGRSCSFVDDDRFIIPEERTMLFDDFFDKFLQSDPHQIYYLQKQNNLIDEFSPLVKDVASHVPWVTEAFGKNPNAANICIGNHRSFTSMRKDHYENIFYVITGEKTFDLYPPVAISWMPYKKCNKFQWLFEGAPGLQGKWHMKDLNEEVEWIVPSHKPETREKFKRLCDAKSYVINVRPGDALYIPALWFYEVRQTNQCFAVNYWYDMKKDIKIPFLNLLNKLCDPHILRKDASVDNQVELEDSLLSDLNQKKEKSVKDEMNTKKFSRKNVK